MSLKGKNAIVTGGGSGIGLAIAASLARLGCQVVIAGRDPAKLATAAQSVGDVALKHHAVDVANRDDVAKLFGWARDSIGDIHILVNSAGTNIKTRRMDQMTPEQWDSVMAINATGAYNCMYHALPEMRSRRDGLIVNISSISGKRASDLGGIAYCASKFAMTALGTAVGLEDAANGVRLTNVFPGEVETPILDNRPHPVTAEHRARILQPEDVADIVVAIALLPPRANVPEVVIKPTSQPYA